MTESFEQRHAILIREFNEYLFDHPEVTAFPFTTSPTRYSPTRTR